MKSINVAVFLLVGNIDGGGGIERYYLNFILMNKIRNLNVDIITSAQSKKNILTLMPDFPENKIKAFPVLNNRFSFTISRFYLNNIIKYNGYEIVHIANFDSFYEPLYKYIAKKTKVSLNVIDCRFTPEFENERYTKIKEFIGSGSLSGIFSWYQNTSSVIEKLKPGLYFKYATICFTEYKRFYMASKKKNIVFAARLSETKRPNDYLNAIAICLKKNSEAFKEWNFLLWGDGEIKPQIDAKISEMQLTNKVKTGFSFDISDIFNSSSIFISTQKYENFTSLSMLEAMASGNAIISYNVGQTDFFVKDGINGILTDENPDALANAMEKLVRSPELLSSMQKQSSIIARETHNIDNFSNELFRFFETTLNIK